MRRIFVLMLVCITLISCVPITDSLNSYNEKKDNTTAGTESKYRRITVKSIKATEKKIDDLFVFCKVWGYLKYYHPSVAKGKYDWDNEFIRLLPEILEVKNTAERDLVLLKWVEELGNYDKNDNSYTVTNNEKLLPSLGWISTVGLDTQLELKLNDIKDAFRSKNKYVSLNPSFGNPYLGNETPYDSMKYPDVGYRLLSLFRYWNIIEYYFPYKYLINESWDDVLKEFIPKLIDAQNELEYNLAILELAARIDDSHSQITSKGVELNKYYGDYYAPLQVKFIEDKVVVTAYHDQMQGEKTGIKIGAIITKAGGKSVEEIIAERSRYTAASNYPTMLRNIAIDLLRSTKNTLDIEYFQDGNIKKVQVDCILKTKLKLIDIFREKEEHFKLIGSDIAYIYPGAIKKEHVAELFKRIKDKKAVIIDLRCYPSEFIVYSLGAHLVPGGREFARFTKGSITKPGLFTMASPAIVGRANKGYFKGKVVILVNEVTQSQAEFTAMAFRTAPNSVVIGSTTAGADGNVSEFQLPGGLNAWFTGIGVYYPDGTETQRVGIVPDIEVKPTIEGIKANRDEVLEKAIELINAN